MKNRSTLKILLCVLALLLLNACSGQVEDTSSNPVEVAPDWSPDQASYTCSDDSMCPDNQGVLLAVIRTVEEAYYRSVVKTAVFRCAGTVYGPTQVITAGHCAKAMQNARHIYFKTASRSGRPSRTFVVTGFPKQNFIDRDETPVADYASAELATPITGVTFAHPALHPASGTELMAIVDDARAHSTAGNINLVLNVLKCTLKPMRLLPYNYSDNPTAFGVDGCMIHKGNSGGAVVEAGDVNAIQGIVSIAWNEDVLHEVQAQQQSEFSNSWILGPTAGAAQLPAYLTTDPIPIFGGFTNARCVSLPGWRPTEAHCLEVTEAGTKQALEKLKSTRIDEILYPYLDRWPTSKYSSQTSGQQHLEFEYEPTLFEESKLPFALSSRNQLGVYLYPIPKCIHGQIPRAGTVFYARIQAIGFKENFTDYVVETPAQEAHVDVRIAPLSGNQYQVSYSDDLDVSFPPIKLNYKKNGKLEQLRGSGMQMTIPACGLKTALLVL